jgi:hypothetical protein
MPTPTEPRSSWLISRIEPAVFGIGSATSASSRPPSALLYSAGFVFWPQFLLLAGEHAGHTRSFELLSRRVRPHSPCLRKDVEPFSSDAQSPLPRASAPGASRRASAPRSRLSPAGFQSRLRVDCVCSHFFPRSVGLGPTASSASGALVRAPSILCQTQAIPSISSYSARPLRQSRTKTPCRFHSRKYLCTELALPNFSGRAFHWQPVLRTYTIASKTLRWAIGLRPPPGRLLYFRRFSRFRLGISGSTFSHNSSETVHDFMAFMPHYHSRKAARCQILFTDKH